MDEAYGGEKRCRKCGHTKPLRFFPQDRSRPDGRWHTCRLCNNQYWKERGKWLALRRKYDKESRSGLRGLRHYSHGGEPLASVPPPLRPLAEQLLSKYLDRHRDHMTPALYASLHGTAASNAVRVGNTSWCRSMLRRKGWRRQERRQAEERAQLQRNLRKADLETPGRRYLPRVSCRGLDGI